MDARSIARIRFWTESLSIVAFLAAVFAPIVDQVLREASLRDTRSEMRAPGKLPRLPHSRRELIDFPKRFESWHRDSFGLRDLLLHWHNVVRFSALHSSPTPRLVLGEGDWIFATDGFALEDHRGALPMSPGLLAEWQRFLERRRDHLAERGIEYVLVAAPNKDVVYPERLPPSFAPVGPSRLDQLLDHLAQHSDMEILDLRPTLRDEKSRDAGEDLTYFPLGTHWTYRGAYAGYAAIVRQLARRLPGLEPLPREAFNVVRSTDPGDSWAARLYMTDRLGQANLAWAVRDPRARVASGSQSGLRATYERTDGQRLPRALLVHDSFGVPVRPWLAEHFSELHCSWATDLDDALVADVRPDVVIQLYSGATLVRFMPILTEEEDGGRTARRFDECKETAWKLPEEGQPVGLETDPTGSLVRDNGTLIFEPGRGDELLYLPEIDNSRDATLVLLVELECEEAGALHVFYKTTYDPTYERRRALHGSFAAGKSSVYLVLPPAEATGRLAMRLGSMHGRYRLHRIEIRRERG